MIKGTEIYFKLEGKSNQDIALIVFFTRLMPQVSFDIVSYATGLTSLNIFSFSIATFLGMIPMVSLYSFFGHSIQPHITLYLTILSISFIAYLIYRIFK